VRLLLTGVEGEARYAPRPQQAEYGGHLDDLGASAQYYAYP